MASERKPAQQGGWEQNDLAEDAMDDRYVEIFAANGALLKATDGHNLDAVILAIESCGPGEYVRYLAPSDATDDEIALVKRMGAAPCGNKGPQSAALKSGGKLKSEHAPQAT